MRRNLIHVIGELDNMIKEWIKYFLTWLVFTTGLVIAIISGVLSLYYLLATVDIFNLIVSALFIPFGTALAVTAWKYKEDQYD